LPLAPTTRYLHGPGAARPDALLLKKGAAYVTRMLRVFGVATQPEFGLSDGPEAAGAISGGDAAAPVVDALAAFRDAVRAGARAAAAGDSGPADLLGLCDRLRDSTLVDLGIRLEDRQDGAVWRRDDPAEMRAEIEAKAAAAAEAAAAKLARKMEAKRAEITKEKEAAVPPSELFLQPRHADRFCATALDPEGRPTLGADKEPLSKAAKKDVEKLYARQFKEHEKHLAKLAKNPRVLQEMQDSLAALYTEGRELLATYGAGLAPETAAALAEPEAGAQTETVASPADVPDAPTTAAVV
jgi:cysteinyl-tRNA synthetase